MRRRHARRRILPSFGALCGDNTPTAALRGLRVVTRSTSSYKRLLELFGERMKKGKASLPLLSMWCLELLKKESPCMGALGVYIGLPPGGTMVIRLGVGPSHLCLRSPASAPAAGARRLVCPTGYWRLGRQAGPTVQGLVGGWLLLLNLGDEGFAEVSVATVLPSGG